jgi:hypothetical protein
MSSDLKILFSGVQEMALAFIANGTLPGAYLPLFMNDANFQQDYWGRLQPETLSYAQGVREAYDPVVSSKIGRVVSNFEALAGLN